MGKEGYDVTEGSDVTDITETWWDDWNIGIDEYNSLGKTGRGRRGGFLPSTSVATWSPWSFTWRS